MFGTQQQQAPKQFGTLFGSSTAPSGGLFGSTNQPQQSGSLFGSTQASQPQQGGSIFGSTLGAPSQQGNAGGFGSSQQNQGGSLFRPAPAFSNPPQQQQQQQQSSIFGGNLMPAPSLGSVLGSSQQQLPQLRQSTLFKPFESASSPRKSFSTVSSVILY
jgi:nuclear pore complex protein Nup54